MNLRDLDAWFNGRIRALTPPGVLGTTLTRMLAVTDPETTQRDVGCGQVTRKRKVTDMRGIVHEIEVTVYG